MNAEQQQRIAHLAEEVAEEFIEAATPSNWTGHGVPMQTQDPTTRGGRNWDVKNASQIGALLVRLLDLKDRIVSKPPGEDDEDDDVAADMRSYEKRAKDLLARVKSRA